MSDQKNIDNLFQERFKDFEASPDPALWDKISDKLDAKEEKRKRRSVVFLPWLYRAAGIAAAIILLFFVGNEFINTDDGIGTDEQVTTTKKDGSLETKSNKNTTNSEVTDTNSTENANKSLQNNEQIVNKDDVIDQHNRKDQNVLRNAVVQQTGTNTRNDSQRSSNTTTQRQNSGNAVATVSNKDHDPKSKANLSVQNKNHVLGETMVVQNTTDSSNSTINATQNSVNNSETTTSSATVAQTGTSGASNSSNTDVTENSEVLNTETAVAKVAETKKDDEIKKSLLDVINDLHDLEKDNAEVAEATPKKWSIAPNASPVYYNSLSNGSPIDETFADNTKTGNVNLSYGVNVGYDVSKRLTIRSGIHKVDYSYNTQDIALVPSINGTQLATVALKSNASYDITDRQVASNEVFSQYQFPSTESSIFQKQIEGDLNQRMSYIEVPVELKYALVDKKLGLNVIGGVSTLVLTENSIILDSPELYTELGEATNINDISFSTNIGIGIDYEISKQLEFNLEPMLKYQINTFSGNTGNFKPYSVGVYTGVSFRF